MVEGPSRSLEDRAATSYTSLRLHTQNVWLWSITVAALVLFYPVILRLVQDWWVDPDYTYGFLIPVFTVYALRRNLADKTLELRPNTVGLPVFLAGMIILSAGILSSELFLSRISMLITVAGLVLFLAGFPFFRAILFPLSYLAFAVPIPNLVYNQITLPLQFASSRAAESMLRFIAIPVFREGNILTIPNCSLEVAQACSGFRSLMALLAVAVAVAYLTERSNYVRVFLVALIFPIAIFTNGLRVCIVGVLAYLIDPNWATGSAHLILGWLLLIFAVSVFLAMCTLSRRVRSKGMSLR